MTDARKKKIMGLIWNLAREAESCGHSKGLKSGIKGTGWFCAGVDPDEAIRKSATETEEVMNELLVLLGLPEYQEHCYTPDPDAAE